MSDNKNTGGMKRPSLPPRIQRMPMKNKKTGITWIITALLILALVIWVVVSSLGTANQKEVPLTDMVTFAKDGKVETFYVKETQVEANLKDDPVVYVAYKDATLDFPEFLKSYGVDVDNASFQISYEPPPSGFTFTDFINILSLVGLGILVFIIFRSMQQSGKGIFEFGQSKARMMIGRKQDIGFSNVAGVDEAREELKEIVMFLDSPKKFTKLGARIPKGVLLVGPPGTGKTLL
ncbi:hypothetical protein KC660_01835, partial [Candidatus Dojkabacteria bacterium]|nr:hypothetical protein [Candidatus Dojkabacteria bacterium]